MARSSMPFHRRSRTFALLLAAGAVTAAVATGVVSSATASIEITSAASAVPAADPAVSAAALAVSTADPAVSAADPVPVSSLAMTGTTTTITVHRVYRRGQVQWIDHVLDTRLLGLDGCQAERTATRWTGQTYRTTVRTVCSAGPASAEAAAHALVEDRPWYQITVSRVPLVGFGLLADLPSGNDRAVAAALAKLPSGPFTFVEGDDVSLSYVGAGVTQAQFDAAVAAFAQALGVPVSSVEITPLAE